MRRSAFFWPQLGQKLPNGLKSVAQFLQLGRETESGLVSSCISMIRQSWRAKKQGFVPKMVSLRRMLAAQNNRSGFV